MHRIDENPGIRFFCDLDHTLIYSHRVPIAEPKTEVEYLNGKAQSFMTLRTLSFLQSQNLIRLIPVTTRSKAQFDRLPIFREDLRCDYALICNGGVLLVDGIEEEAWYRESLSMVSEELPELHSLRQLAEQLSPASRIHDVHCLYFYLKHSEPEVFARQFIQYAQPQKVRILYDRHKVYFLPVSLNKGSAVARFAKRFGPAMSVAAGDSEFDISMLRQADIRIVPPALKQYLPPENTHVVEDGIFSDGICTVLNTSIKRGNPQK